MFKKIVTFIALMLFGFSMVGCSKKGEVIKFDSQLDALNQLSKGTVEVCVIDSVMAGYYTSQGDFKDKLAIVPEVILANEQYGIAAKKGNDSLIQNINKGLYQLFAAGEYQTLATKYNLKESDYAVTNNTAYEVTATDNSYSAIETRKKVVIGYTVFAPIAYTDTETNTLTGFDVELATKVFNQLNPEIEIEWMVINWDAKEALLQNGTIDLVWNGMTITDERIANMSISIPYLNNNQVAVVNAKKVNDFNTVEKLAKAIIGVEKGSAGEDAAVALNK